MGALHASRRAVLGAIVAAPVLMLSTSQAVGASSEWQTALHAYRQSQRAFDAALSELEIVESRFNTDQPERPRYIVEAEGDYGRFGRHVLPVHIHEDDLADPTKVYDTPERTAAMRDGFATYHRAVAALKEQIGYAAAEDRYRRASKANTDALDDLLAVAPASVSMLADKVEIIIAEYDDTDDRIAGILADLRRLAGEARP